MKKEKFPRAQTRAKDRLEANDIQEKHKNTAHVYQRQT